MTIKERLLDEIADSLIAFLIEDSEERYKKILTAVEAAGRDYKGAEYSWWTRSIFTYWRSRKGLAKSLENEIREFPENRLLTLGKIFFDAEGGWEDTSLNICLLVRLLGAVDNKENPTEEKFYYSIAKEIAKSFKTKLQCVIHERKLIQLNQEAKAQELKELSEKTRREALDFVTLFSDESLAQNFAAVQPDQASFSLMCTQNQWQLNWYDLSGEKNALPLSDKLITLLAKRTMTDELLLKNEALKYECLMARDALINSKKLLINPSSSELNGLHSTFVLKGVKPDYELNWYDNLGECRNIELRLYPELKKFLQSQDFADTETIPLLQSLLRKVNIAKTPQGIAKARLTLERFFKGQVDNVPSFQVLVNPKVHELAGLVSTFILYTHEDFKLEWYDLLGNGTEISMKAYPQLQNWISKHNPITEVDHPELKQKLAQVDTSRRMDLGEDFKKQLQACLSMGVGKSLPLKEKSPQDTPAVTKPSKINLENFALVAGLFGHRPAPKVEEGTKQQISLN